MFITQNFEYLIDPAKYAMEDTTYVAYYKYWMDELFERTMRLFVEKTDPVPPEEVELRLMLQGHVGIAQLPMRFPEGGLTAFFGEPNGISKYLNRKPNYCVRSPIWSKNLKVGEEVVVIRNNVLMNPLMDLVHHYAQILAHTDVTYVHTMVDARDGSGTPVASTSKQKTSIQSYLKNKFNGKFDFVTDIGAMGMDVIGQNIGLKQSCYELWNTRERIIASYMASIGVKSALDKNSNTVVDEVNADTPSLIINLEDMLKCRKEGFEAVNDLFGTSWTVELNKNLDYVNIYTKPEVKADEKDN